jgi:hypothetical protein
MQKLFLPVAYLTILSGLVHINATDDHKKINIKLAADFDGVQTYLRPWYTYLPALPWRCVARVLWCSVTSPSFWADMHRIAYKGLTDEQGKAVIGSDACIAHITKKYYPTISENDKKTLRNLAFYVTPNVNMTNLCNELQNAGVPVHTWTNNTRSEYFEKLNKLNTILHKQGFPQLSPNGFHCGNTQTKDNNAYSKSDVTYFKNAYDKFSSKPLVIFVDDNRNNIAVAQQAAKIYNLNIEAHHYTAQNHAKLVEIMKKKGIL